MVGISKETPGIMCLAYGQLDRRARVPGESTPLKMFDDPSYDQQWHLHDPVLGLSVPGAWLRGYDGTGITISILDDGLEGLYSCHSPADHPDLVNGYQAEISYNINRKQKVPTPERGDNHGTSAAGLAAGRDNTVCGVGASYRAKIAGVRMISQPTSDAEVRPV